MPRITFTDDVSTYISQSPECQSSAPFAMPRPMQPQVARANSLRPSPPTHRPSNVPSLRPTKDDQYGPISPAFIPPSTSEVAPYTDHSMNLGTSRPLPPIPALTERKKADHSVPNVMPPQPVRYITSISQMLPSTKPHDADASTSNESGLISVHQDICCGNKDCIIYSVTSLPSSVLPYDDEMLYRALPATEPPLSSFTIEVPNFSHIFKVNASASDFVTISDVLEAIYQNRSYLGTQWFRGLYWAGDRLSLQLLLTDTD
ncbi:hypothetical protein AX14_006274 [Amanita brunnescens Koide BX004]|nr:hypothetical protein AX14_006274 [Amanita brunnescens Koide BX004]